jgi:hypothetical protein
VPEDDIDAFLSEVARVATYFYFTIDDAEDPPWNSHICVHEYPWWTQKLKKARLAGKLNKPAEYWEKCEEMMTKVQYITRGKDGQVRGFNIYGNKVLQE